MYRVVKAFCDLQDTVKAKSGAIYHEYRVGDTYPREGYAPSEARIAELAGASNAQGVPLIAADKESMDIADMTKEQLLAFARDNGIVVDPKACKDDMIAQIEAGAAASE